MNAKPYPEYKESGVQWLGNVPEHWVVKRLKTSATYKVSNVDKVSKEDELPVRLCNYTDVYYHDHITPDMNLMEATATPEEISRFHLEVDDIIITKDSEDWRDIAIPARVEATSPDLVCGYHLAIILPKPGVLDGRYLLRAFQSSAVNQQFQIAASGVTRYGLPKSSIGEAELPIPPLPEQTAIADFLDRETGRIDVLVAKKRRLIELLKEKRTALISRTVTRGLPADVAREFGLDPHTCFRDSGIDWLGEVPVGWGITKGRYIGRLLGSIPVSEGDVVTGMEDGIPYAKVDDLNRIDASLALLNTEYKIAVGFRSISTPFLLFPKRGAAIFTNKVAIALQPMIFDPNLMGWQINSSFDIKFVAYCLIARRLDDLADISTIPQINNKHINPSGFPAPPLPEQTAITTYLDRETSKIDRLVEKVEAAVGRLQEYRTALITAAVTGKIDVREAVA